MLLAEKLLLDMGIHLPVRERDAVKALEVLREPFGIVQRRKAREYLRGPMIEYGEQMQGKPIVETLADDEIRTSIGPQGVLAYTMPVTPELVQRVPEELRRYLHRDSEPDLAYDDQVFVKGMISTGGLYRLDGGEDGTQGVLDSVFGGLPLTELPPLPYSRMWFEARGPDGGYVPLWSITPPEGSWNANDSRELWGVAISEIVPGSSWGVAVVRKDTWTYEVLEEAEPKPFRSLTGEAMVHSVLTSIRYERVSARDLLLSPSRPEDMFGPEHDVGTEGAYRGAMMAWAICLADMVTARNVDRRESFLSRRVKRQLDRVAVGGKFAARVYDVSIATATGDAMDETGRHLSVRFLVRGHWRKSQADHAQWVDAKEAHCVWIPGFVKGPPGAPWKGRPVYVEPKGGSR
jgi:hypothetical protein